MAHHPSLHIVNPDIKNYVHTDFVIELLDGGSNFTEGPVWNAEGFYLFSDIPENVVYKLVPGGAKEVYLSPSGCTHNNREDLHEQIGSNGLAYEVGGHLLLCQHGNHAVAQFNGRELAPFLTGYADRPFNSPNDIVASRQGKIFFSDPPYGLKGQVLHPGKFQPVAGLYCWDDAEVLLLTDRYQYPNGVCLSPDHRILYTCSSKPFENVILEFDTDTLQLRRELCRENSDGIKCDRHGNLYLAAKEGVVILDREGARLAVISLDAIPANLCWGGSDGTDLFITARQNVYLVRNLQQP